MKDIKQINFTENRQVIATEIRSAFGADFSQKFVEEWIQIIINEAEVSQYKDYSIEHIIDLGELLFAQYGKKEYYHDGSCEPRKFVWIASITEEEYTEARKRQCVLESNYQYRNGWFERGDERFFTYWQGRCCDYIYYAKNLSGIPFVRVKIETLY